MSLDKILIKIPNNILSNNSYYIQFVIILYITNGYDLIFVPTSREVIIKLKAPPGWQKIVKKHYPDWIENADELDRISMEDYSRFIFQIKLGTSMNLVDNIIQSVASALLFNGIDYHVRLSIHPSIIGESLSMRMLHPIIYNADSLPDVKPGINLIVGPTCSGKTTFMYSWMYKINQQGKSIISLEDPVEKELPFVMQTSVDKLKYADYLKSSLRQNPDIIAIGEIRDAPCAKAVFQAALTGHSVIATMHSIVGEDERENINHCFMRLKEFGIKDSYIKQLVAKVVFCQSNGRKQIISKKIKRLMQENKLFLKK